MGGLKGGIFVEICWILIGLLLLFFIGGSAAVNFKMCLSKVMAKQLDAVFYIFGTICISLFFCIFADWFFTYLHATLRKIETKLKRGR